MEAVLKIQDLRVSYPYGFKKEKIALKGISLEINKGEIFGLLGPNGAGKTTLIKSILGLINIGSGSITIFGKNYLSSEAKQRLGYMPEIANYYWFMTPREILKMFGEMCGLDKATLAEKITKTLELMGLGAEANQLVARFSKGMQSRLNVAQALLHDPEFLILDEPFSGLDPVGRIHMRNILKGLKGANKTILLSSHELSEAELICDTVCVMRDGRILKYGSLAKLVQERGEHSLENYFVNIIAKTNE